MSSPREASSNPIQPTRSGNKIVVEDLKRFGPNAIYDPVTIEHARKYCKSLANRHYENFSIASLLVPSNIRQDFFNIYAYCRWSDDLADEIGNSENSIQLLDWWRAELRACYSGTAKHPVFVALKQTIANHSLTIGNFEHLLDAFIQDQTVTRFRSQLDIFEYCRGSANPVGRILLELARVNDPAALTLSDRVCSGLQIANFCQDVRHDALNGRIYLPKDLWERFQITESEVLAGQRTDNLCLALKVWVELARTSLVSGLPLVKLTPRWLARDLQLFVRGGLAILDNIALAKFNVWDRPINVTKKQKLALLARAIVSPRSTQVAELARPRGSQLG